jgi:hypothetical protein
VPGPESIISAAKTGGGALWSVWIEYRNSKELRELLVGSLAIAICEKRRDADDVRRLAVDLDRALRETAIPEHKKPGLVDRAKGGAKGLARKLSGGRFFREVPAIRAFGPTFGAHLEGWLRETASSNYFEDRFFAIECEQEHTLDALCHRFPDAFEEELFTEEKVSALRERLTDTLLLSDLVRAEKARHVEGIRLRRAAEQAAATAVAPGALAAVGAQAAGAHDAVVIAAGAGAAALGALVGAITRPPPASLTKDQANQRHLVLTWIAGLLGHLTNEKPSAANARALQAPLSTALWDAQRGQLQWHAELANAPEQVERLREAVSDAGDELLAQELGKLATALEQARTNYDLGPHALERLYEVVAVCDLPRTLPA